MSTQPPAGVPKPPQPAQPATSTPVGSDSQIDLPTDKSAPDFINLPLGKELNDDGAQALAKSRPVEWIVLGGPSDSGKTTLLTSLYELFQWNKVKGHAFAGSITLPGFEERCYLSRRDSGNPKPHTRRTPYEGPDPKYLHLRTRSNSQLRQFTDFLFTDVSGEMFDHARDSVPECKKMYFLKRAHHLLLFLDSGKAVQTTKRWRIVEDTKALLRSCMDSEMIWEKCIVSVVWSRFDYFMAKDMEPDHSQFRNDAEEEFRRAFSKLGSRLKFSEVAARPLEVPELHIGHGVQALFDEWAATPLEMKADDLFPTSFSGARESELFGARHFSSTKTNEEPNK